MTDDRSTVAAVAPAHAVSATGAPRSAIASGFAGAARVVFAILLLVTAIAVIVPFAPHMPSDGLDPSWVFGMNAAVAQGLAFGRDIVFTFGPYASVYTRTYHPATDAMMLYASLWFAVSFALAAWLVFRRGHAALAVALLVVFAGLLYSRDALLFAYPLLVATWLQRTTVAAGPAGHGPRPLWLVAVLFAPFGLLPLVKGSVLLACAALGGLCVILLARRRDWAGIAAAIGAPALAMLALWVMAGQSPAALPGYFIAMAPIIGGYSEAMSLPGDGWQLVTYLVAAGMVLWAVARAAPGTRFERAIGAAMFALVLFLAFKGGFVRHDGHALLANSMLLVAALIAATFGGRRAAVALAVAVLAWFHVDHAFQKTDVARVRQTIAATYTHPWHGLRNRIRDDGALAREFAERVAQLAATGGLPSFPGTVDIYSYDQTYLLATGNRWNPRPVLQSYSAYTPELAERNRLHLLGPGRPDHIVFKIQHIDNRYPSLEDGASWPALLAGYRPVSMRNGGYLFLDARTPAAGGAPVALTHRTHRLGERVDIPSARGPVFARLVARPSLLGRFANLLLKPTPLQITVELHNGTVRTYRLVAGMAQAGFVLSPVVERAEEFGLLYAGAAMLEDMAVRAITVTAPEGGALWNDVYTLHLEELPDAPSPEAIGLYSIVRPLPASEFPAATDAAQCDGFIDVLNGVSPAPTGFAASRRLDARGWLAISARDGVLPDEVFLVLTAADGRRHFVPTTPTPRPDVGAHFGRSELDASGYSTTADLSELRGRHSLTLAYLDAGRMHVCRQYDIAADLGPRDAP